MGILLKWFLNTLSIVITSYLLPGVHVDSLVTALLTALVLGIINATIKPVLLLFTFPITVLTLGLFTLVVNALLILLTSRIIPGFQVDGFWWALLFSLVLTFVSSILDKIFSK